MSCFLKHPQGETIIPYEFPVHVPPAGYVWDYFKGEWAQRPIHSRSEEPSKQYWERPVKDFDYDRRRTIEKRKQKTNPFYTDPELEAFREQEWDRRINGFWFMNNGKATYITGCHYMYLTWWRIDIGYPGYREPDKEFFYMWNYVEDDPESFGLIEAARRRSGKTYRSTVVMYEAVSRAFEHNAGMQSKTRPDAQKIFSKLINAFRALPDFFQPVYDTSGGTRPKNVLSFFARSKKNQEEEEEELRGKVDFESVELLAYDGQKLHRYLRDECLGEEDEVMMFDGSHKKTKQLSIGDQLMGEDGNPVAILNINEGNGEMYEVIPNKGNSFTCNGDHKLLLKWCRRDYKLFGKYSFGDRVEIPVSDYILLGPSLQKHLVLFKNEVLEFTKKELPIDPYTLGVWLGDGSSLGPYIYSQEDEIFESIPYSTRIKDQGSLKVHKVEGLTNLLRKNNLYGNKHVPDIYLKSSSDQRFDLLAGLLDSDGHLSKRNGKPCQYDFVNKNKNISESVCTLANSLGFYSSIKKKEASLKRSDGSVYKCNVWRVHIYGDLYKIPCKAPQKIATAHSFHVNRRNPLNKGFIINAIGTGRYISISTEAPNSFLLKDGTVVSNCGKTKDVDVSIGWSVVRECLKVGTKTIVGKALYTTTIEEGGSAAFRKLWNTSDFNKKDEHTNRTLSGMYRTFTAAYKNDEDFFDIYGFCDQQLAKNTMQQFRNALAHDQKQLAEYIRKNPFTIEEAFFSINDQCVFDSLKINQQAKIIGTKDESEWFTYGNFVWENGNIGDNVIFRPNPNGRWKIHNKFLELNKKIEGGLTNKWERVGDRYKPMADNIGITGADTFDHKLKNLSDEQQASNAAFYTFWRYDPIAPELENTFVCEYIYRQSTPDLMSEDLLMQCVYFGTPVIIENNKPGAIHFIQRNGYKDFVIRVEGRDGISGTPKNKQSMAEVIDGYIGEFIENVVFPDLLLDWNGFSLENSTQYDATMGSGWTLLIATRLGKKFQKQPDHLKNDSEYGDQSQLYSKFL